MPFAADFELADVDEHLGTLFAAGYRNGKLWCRHSIDQGTSDAQFPDGTTEKPITSVGSAVKPSILVYNTRDVSVWFGRDGRIVSYYSEDGGMSWIGGGIG
jgi:hypothetical protein